MDLVEARTSTSAEEGDWYDALRTELVLSVLHGGADVLDFGCGSAGVLQGLASSGKAGSLLGYDPALSPDERADLAARGVSVTSDLSEAPAASFDLVLLMDVLEHVTHPEDVLSDALARVRPGGRVLITVPAYRWLWSGHDIALGHVDRYTLSRLRVLTRKAALGWHEERAGYAFPSLLAGVTPSRVWQRVRARFPRRTAGTSPAASQMQDVGPGVATVVQRVGSADLRTIGTMAPFGLTVVQVLVRPVDGS